MATPKRVAATPPTAGSTPTTNPVAPAPVDKATSAFSINNKLIKFLLQRALTTDGLFLEDLPEHQQTEFRILQRRLKDETIEHSFELLEHTKNTQVVAQLLLEFLKDLPEPLLTYPNYDSFIMSIYIKEKAHRTKYCAQLLNTAPPHHVALATQLLTLLHRLVANRAVNHLTSDLLAPLFAPHFLRPKKICPYMKEDEDKILAVMVALIDDYDFLFTGDGTLVSSGSAKIRKVSDSPYVTDLSQSQIGSGKLGITKPNVPTLDVGKGHKRSASSATSKLFAAAMGSPTDTRSDKEDELTADDFSDEEQLPPDTPDASDASDLTRSRIASP